MDSNEIDELLEVKTKAKEYIKNLNHLKEEDLNLNCKKIDVMQNEAEINYLIRELEKDYVPKTKKEIKKEESAIAKKYLKAKYNAKIGYKFKSYKYFLKNNSQNFKRNTSVILAVISVLCLFISIMLLVTSHHNQEIIDKYQNKNQKLNSELKNANNSVSNQESTINKFNISTDKNLIRATNLASKLFKSMYEYNNGEQYEKNRNEALKLFETPKDKWIDDVYSNGKDADGANMIDNLNLSSEVMLLEPFTDNMNSKNNSTIKLKTLVQYESSIDGVSSDYASRTHEALYDLEVNAKTHKISKLKKINTVKEINTIN